MAPKQEQIARPIFDCFLRNSQYEMQNITKKRLNA